MHAVFCMVADCVWLMLCFLLGLQSDELVCQKKLRQEIIQLEDTLATVYDTVNLKKLPVVVAPVFIPIINTFLLKSWLGLANSNTILTTTQKVLVIQTLGPIPISKEWQIFWSLNVWSIVLLSACVTTEKNEDPGMRFVSKHASVVKHLHLPFWQEQPTPTGMCSVDWLITKQRAFLWYILLKTQPSQLVGLWCSTVVWSLIPRGLT